MPAPNTNNMPQPPALNPALKPALVKFKAENSPQNLNAILNELVRSPLLVPASLSFGANPPKPDAQGRVALPKDTAIQVVLLNTPEGKKYYMAFSDWEAVKSWKPEKNQQVLMMRLDDFANMLQRNQEAAGLVINPFTEGFRMEAPLVQAVYKRKQELAMQHAQTQIKPGDKVTIVELPSYPDALVDPLCEVLADAPAIAAAYLQVMIVNETARSYLLVLDGPKDDAVYTALAKAAQPFLAAKEHKIDLNITISASPLGQQGMRGSEPFYRKGIGRVPEEDDEE